MTIKFDFKTLETGFEADWPVQVAVPVDGGKVEQREFMARFRTPTPAEIEAADKIEDQTDKLKLIVQTGFIGLGAGETDTLTPAMFEQMWTSSNVQLALIRAYGTFRTASPAKN
ncbi:hypothetical protein D3C71_314430 [compost metagenome]